MEDEEGMDDEEFYTCMACGYEAHPDKFGKYCPNCGEDLDELEAMNDQRN